MSRTFSRIAAPVAIALAFGLVLSCSNPAASVTEPAAIAAKSATLAAANPSGIVQGAAIPAIHLFTPYAADSHDGYSTLITHNDKQYYLRVRSAIFNQALTPLEPIYQPWFIISVTRGYSATATQTHTVSNTTSVSREWSVGISASLFKIITAQTNYRWQLKQDITITDTVSLSETFQYPENDPEAKNHITAGFYQGLKNWVYDVVIDMVPVISGQTMREISRVIPVYEFLDDPIRTPEADSAIRMPPGKRILVGYDLTFVDGTTLYVDKAEYRAKVKIIDGKKYYVEDNGAVLDWNNVITATGNFYVPHGVRFYVWDI